MSSSNSANSTFSDLENLEQNQKTNVSGNKSGNSRRSSNCGQTSATHSIANNQVLNARRKSSLTYQQQLQIASRDNSESHSVNDIQTGRYSPHPNELFVHHPIKLSIQPIDRYEDSATCCLPPPSPAPNSDRFIVDNSHATHTQTTVNTAQTQTQTQTNNHQRHHLQISSSTSTSSLSTLSSCGGSLNNGVVPIPSLLYNNNPSVCIPHTNSPNQRLRIGTERLPSHRSSPSSVENANHSTPRFGSTSNFLAHNTSIVTADTYNYLTSTVHTPVKRYVPTPPPPNEHFTPDQTNMVPANSKCLTSQYVNTLPYRYRLKCCSNDVPQSNNMQNQNSLEYQPLSMTDYYATSPRVRSAITTKTVHCIGNGTTTTETDALEHEKQQKSHQKLSTKNSSSSRSHTPIDAVSLAISSTNTPSRNSSLITSSYPNNVCMLANKTTQNSMANSATATGTQQSNKLSNEIMASRECVEYTNAASMSPTNKSSANNLRMLGVSTVNSNNKNFSNSESNSSSTCLHCNTVRRTTGVHQTTQTTGPISPIPLSSGTNFCSNSHDQYNVAAHTTTPPNAGANDSSHISPLSPLEHSQQQQQQHYTDNDQQQVSSFIIMNQHQQFQLSHNQKMHTNDSAVVGNDCSNNIDISMTAKLQQSSSHQPSSSSCNRQMHQQIHQIQSQQQQNQSLTQQRYSCKRRLSQYLRKEIAQFFGVYFSTESEEYALWIGRQKRLAIRRFGAFKSEIEMQTEFNLNTSDPALTNNQTSHYASDRPDILPVHDSKEDRSNNIGNLTTQSLNRNYHYYNVDFEIGDHIERKASVSSMFANSLRYIIQTFSRRQPRRHRQWSRSFAPAHIHNTALMIGSNSGDDNSNDFCDIINTLQDNEVFFDSTAAEQECSNNLVIEPNNSNSNEFSARNACNIVPNINMHNSGAPDQRQLYVGERIQGWRTSAVLNDPKKLQNAQQKVPTPPDMKPNGIRGNRISAHLLDGVLENSRRPAPRKVKLFCVNDLDDRTDHRPFFTYWINTVQILVLFLSLICYGIGPVGVGLEQKTGQVLVTSLSLQTVQHAEQRNVWIGPKNNDLVHMGAKFATCMRRDVKIIDVLLKTRRQERETACCIRNDDSGCVQSSQADCTVRGPFPPKSISTWKKWSPGESGPGGRISGSVCGLDPKYCDAPASIAPYEWPDDITKWPICRKANQFSQRFRYKDHTAEHMTCDVLGHPCCTGVFGECRITTREYCDFVNGYFHEEASLCSQVSCLSNVCGMFPFISVEAPDQLYRLFTSLCMHAGILHLAITVVFQHVFLADLERLIGPIRTAILYICSGIAGNLASAVLLPYKAEVGPSASLSGVLASLFVLLILIHWKHLHKPHVALFKLVMTGAFLFAIGALPWQLNFAGLIAGLICGILLTIALVPFVSVSKYKRKTKINTIWSCIVIHMFMYSFMLIVFYLFPTELNKLSVGEFFSNSFNPSGNGIGISNKEALSSTARVGAKNQDAQLQHQMEPQFYYHHHSDDIIRNSASVSESKLPNHLQSAQKAAHYQQHHSNGFFPLQNFNNKNNTANPVLRYNFIKYNSIFNETINTKDEAIYSEYKNNIKLKNNNNSNRHLKSNLRHYGGALKSTSIANNSKNGIGEIGIQQQQNTTIFPTLTYMAREMQRNESDTQPQIQEDVMDNSGRKKQTTYLVEADARTMS